MDAERRITSHRAETILQSRLKSPRFDSRKNIRCVFRPLLSADPSLEQTDSHFSLYCNSKNLQRTRNPLPTLHIPDLPASHEDVSQQTFLHDVPAKFFSSTVSIVISVHKIVFPFLVEKFVEDTAPHVREPVPQTDLALESLGEKLEEFMMRKASREGAAAQDEHQIFKLSPCGPWV